MERKLKRDKKHIQTASGVKFYPFKPSSLDVVLEDGAQALSLQCRYSGHTKWKDKMKHYSVAQHSLYVSYVCKYPLWGLLHDLTEAYCVDVPTPIKKRRFHDCLRIKSIIQTPQTSTHSTIYF